MEDKPDAKMPENQFAGDNNNSKNGSVFTISDFSSTAHLAEKGPKFDDDDDYNPFEHRDLKHATTTMGSLAHLLKSSLGSGILAMPLAFKNAGLVFGLIGTIVVGFLCTHCVHILVKTSHQICKDLRIPCLGFAETAEKVFENGPKKLRPWSNWARQFVDGSLVATYYAASCVYIVFIAKSLEEVINYDLKIDLHIRVYIGFTIIPILFLGQIRKLKFLVPFSTMANIFIVVTFAITIYYMFNAPLKFDDKPLVAEPHTWPLFFATVIFAMEGIGVVMPVENHMKKPQHFLGCPGVLNTAMIVVVVLYAALGFFGYVRYGDKTEGSITLNLEKGEWLADVAKMLMALAILFTYGLQFFVPNDILWRKIQHKVPKHRHNIAQIAIRTIAILVTGLIAVAVPTLDPIISLVGAVFFSLLGIFIPSVVETIYLYPDRLGPGKVILLKNIVLALFSIFALVSGSITSIENIIKHYG